MPDGNYKITDFGLARGGPFHYVTKQSGAVFTVWYRPPEILQQQIYILQIYLYNIKYKIF